MAANGMPLLFTKIEFQPRNQLVRSRRMVLVGMAKLLACQALHLPAITPQREKKIPIASQPSAVVSCIP